MICERHGIALIEDCAHTMGAGVGRPATGTWGRPAASACRATSTPTAGEGGLLVTDDDDVAAQAILLSGSYMLYSLAPCAARRCECSNAGSTSTPNFSLRMSNLAAAVARPQLGAALRDRAARWNQRHAGSREALPARRT